MTKINIGCAGWDYSDWRGTFYPKNLKRQNYLNYYSKFFDCIENNTTFYNIPSEETVHNWLKQVPVNFKFSIKVWQNITHNIKYFPVLLEDLKRRGIGIIFVIEEPIGLYNCIYRQPNLKILFGLYDWWHEYYKEFGDLIYLEKKYFLGIKRYY